VDLVINTPEGTGPLLDSKSIRSTATELSLPLFTTIAAAEVAVKGIALSRIEEEWDVYPIQEYLESIAGSV
jgi:carbamoyl-phosphate synthase large subunit